MKHANSWREKHASAEAWLRGVHERPVDGLPALLVSLGRTGTSLRAGLFWATRWAWPGTSLHAGLFWAASWTWAPMMDLNSGYFGLGSIVLGLGPNRTKIKTTYE